MKKTYFYNGGALYDNNQAEEFYGTVQVWFWQSPQVAFKEMQSILDDRYKFNRGVKLAVDVFERVK